MKKIIIILFTATVFFAQEENQSQSIELPDFVITGRENISITKVQKNMPDFIPLLSRDFFTLRYPGAEKIKINLPKVRYQIVNLPSNLQKTNLFVKLNGGLHTLPSGHIFYNNSIGNLSFNTKLYGRRILEYVDNADNHKFGGSVNAYYYVNHNSSFLPGLVINLNGDFYKEKNKFYGSELPRLERETENGFAEFGINYLTNSKFSFGIGIKDDYYFQDDYYEFKENVIHTSGFLKIRTSKFGFNASVSMLNQIIDIRIPNSNFANQYYYNGLVTFDFNSAQNIFLKAGFYVAGIEAKPFFTPVVYAKIKANKFLSLYGEFSPNTEFHTLKDFRNSNRFYRFNNFTNVFQKNKFNLKFAAKYEFEKYFEINFGGGYIKSDNTIYFEDRYVDGLFFVNKINANKTYAFLNLLFRKGPFGEFFGELQIQNIKDKDGNVLPYKPVLMSNLKYSYNWQKGYGLSLGLNYFHKSFTDLENIGEISGGIDLSADFYYKIFSNFKIILTFENALNSKYYYLRNYDAKPFDVLAGIEFKW
ncbi:MAG: hypothetical protein CR986_04495 [Ignavibacteriae bacterium]|nr:MAG: hypothetical protein CR986_04495 [Ignavibacteriota bacterium]